MQRIYNTQLSVEEYLAQEAHRLVVPEGLCGCCGKRAKKHRHGFYERGVVGGRGKVLEIPVARFLCTGCSRTVSYLPCFTLSYRLMQVASFEAYLDGIWKGRDVAGWLDLLQVYGRKMERFGPELLRTVGYGFGRAPPREACSAKGLLAWLRMACGSLGAATGQLVTLHKITVFKRYQCHQSKLTA